MREQHRVHVLAAGVVLLEPSAQVAQHVANPVLTGILVVHVDQDRPAGLELDERHVPGVDGKEGDNRVQASLLLPGWCSALRFPGRGGWRAWLRRGIRLAALEDRERVSFRLQPNPFRANRKHPDRGHRQVHGRSRDAVGCIGRARAGCMEREPQVAEPDGRGEQRANPAHAREVAGEAVAGVLRRNQRTLRLLARPLPRPGSSRLVEGRVDGRETFNVAREVFEEAEIATMGSTLSPSCAGSRPKLPVASVVNRGRQGSWLPGRAGRFSVDPSRVHGRIDRRRPSALIGCRAHR